MAYSEPVLVKRIDADPAKRKIHWYDDYVATGGYIALRKALDLKPDDIIKTVTDSGLRGARGAAFRRARNGRLFPRKRRVRTTWR